MSSRRPQDFSSLRRVHGKLSFAVRGKDVIMAEGGYDKREVVPGGRRSGGLFHVEVVQGRGAEKAVAPRSRGRQERRQGEGEWGGGRRTITAVDECRNEMIDRVARYWFD